MVAMSCPWFIDLVSRLVIAVSNFKRDRVTDTVREREKVWVRVVCVYGLGQAQG